MTFYPDKKDGMSPSALSQWLQSRASFVKSYFLEEKGPETAAMKGGTRIHRLIEAGLVEAKHVFAHSEEELSVPIVKGKVFRGRPDSFGDQYEEEGESVVDFVDYKSGKANEWKDKLPVDIKMRATAFLVWVRAGRPSKVKGYIEFFATTWDDVKKEIVLIEGKDTEVIDIEYSAAEMVAFEKVIEKEMENVNAFYVKWQSSSSEFVDKEDVARYAELDMARVKIEAEQETIKASIHSQMEFGGVDNFKSEFGTFYTTTRETYEYPEDLLIGGGVMTLKDAEEISAKAKAAKKNYELSNEPASSKVSVAFKPLKAK